MANVRYWAPRAAALRHASGRAYALAANTPLDLAESEAEQIDHASAGAVRLGRSGTTALRPAVLADSVRGVRLGEVYFDTTAAKAVMWTGAGWIDPMTGAAA